jgi:transposase
MFYLGIDQHSKQLTVNLRNEEGTAVIGRQVSTEWERVREFLSGVRDRCAADGGYVAIVEVCGFNDWLLKLLPEYGCRDVVLIQADERSRKKTDRRDASRLSELLWINRGRLLAGQPVQGLRRVFIPSAEDQENRQLTALRKRLTDSRTRQINRVKHVLHKHNRLRECPTKGFRTQAARAWLKGLSVGELDRFEVRSATARHHGEPRRRVFDEQPLTLNSPSPSIRFVRLAKNECSRCGDTEPSLAEKMPLDQARKGWDKARGTCVRWT